ncbi:SH3 domain-containing protein [Campylobacter sp. FMV-PI01]|uniref:SH3 domain-containing protein n=1 Tax=Campylobacter portucalensis TaxID=2608384 RepID=A0A6L5WIM9_9BACT|nr:SH3 domain-containing protein [Campylobacter portucalensis]MSN96999.1 SH3 domain-containing protein [Campylobacter portucalensis]
MLRLLVLFLFIFNYTFSNDIEYLEITKPNSSNKKQILEKKHLSIDDLKKIAPSDEGNLDMDDSKIYQDIRVTDLLLSTTNMPKSVFKNQIFSLNLIADIQQDINLDLNLSMEKSPNLKWLNQKVEWQKNGGIFKTKLWFESNSTNIGNLKLNVLALRNGEVFQKASISPRLPKVKSVEDRLNYANIVADDLEIISYKTSKFDDKSNIMTIFLKTKNSNIASFYIENDEILKQGVSSIKGIYPDQSAYYFVVFKNDKTSLNFSYFNAKTKQFSDFSLDVKLEIDDLSTQTEINPLNDPFLIQKKFLIYFLAGILIFIFILSRNSTPLIFAILLIAYQIYSQNSYSTGVIKANTKVKILPIEKSTIFYISKNDENVKIFDENLDYYKIMVENGKVGWIEKSSLKIENN